MQVRADIEIARVRPELHGQVAEHLGSCAYGGLWVGRGSPIANTNGFRTDAVRWLKELGVPVRPLPFFPRLEGKVLIAELPPISVATVKAEV